MTAPSFDLGFDLSASFAAGRLTGVDPSGPAAAAGLAEGMDFEGVSNSNRFSNAWRDDVPVTIRLRTGENRMRHFRYFPLGVPHSLLQYRPSR